MRNMMSHYLTSIIVLLISAVCVGLVIGTAKDIKKSDNAITNNEDTTLVNVAHKTPTVDPDDFIVESNVIDYESDYSFDGHFSAFATYTNENGTVDKIDISDHVSIRYCGKIDDGYLSCDEIVEHDELIDTSEVGGQVYRFTLNFNGVQLARDFTFYVRLNTDDLERVDYIHGFINVSEQDYSRIKRIYLREPSTKVKYYSSLNTDEFYFTGMDKNERYELYLQLDDDTTVLLDSNISYTSGAQEIGSYSFAI